MKSKIFLAISAICTILVYGHSLLDAMDFNHFNQEQYTMLENVSNEVFSKMINEHSNSIADIKQIIIELNNGLHTKDGNFHFERPVMFHLLSQTEQNIYNAAEHILNCIIRKVLNKHDNNLRMTDYITNDNDKNQVMGAVKILSNKTEKYIKCYSK